MSFGLLTLENPVVIKEAGLWSNGSLKTLGGVELQRTDFLAAVTPDLTQRSVRELGTQVPVLSGDAENSGQNSQDSIQGSVFSVYILGSPDAQANLSHHARELCTFEKMHFPVV